MAFKDFPDTPKGRKDRRAYYESEDGIALIELWRRQGVKMEDIAKDYIGISVEAFRKWRRSNPAIQKACDVAIEVCNSNVEMSLYQRACGYDYWEEVWELIEGELRLARKIKRHMPPDTKAILQWLFNKMPNSWRAIQEPLEQTQYADTVKSIIVAMKEVAENGTPKEIETKEGD